MRCCQTVWHSRASYWAGVAPHHTQSEEHGQTWCCAVVLPRLQGTWCQNRRHCKPALVAIMAQQLTRDMGTAWVAICPALFAIGFQKRVVPRAHTAEGVLISCRGLCPAQQSSPFWNDPFVQAANDCDGLETIAMQAVTACGLCILGTAQRSQSHWVVLACMSFHSTLLWQLPWPPCRRPCVEGLVCVCIVAGLRQLELGGLSCLGAWVMNCAALRHVMSDWKQLGNSCPALADCDARGCLHCNLKELSHRKTRTMAAVVLKHAFVHAGLTNYKEPMPAVVVSICGTQTETTA